MGNHLDNKVFSNSIVLARVADGTSANQFVIETEFDEILRFDTDSNVDKISFSPEYYIIKVLDLESTNNSLGGYL
jgi:hypothetical protein